MSPLDLHPLAATITKKRKHDDYGSDVEDYDSRRSSHRYKHSNVSVHLHQGSSKSARRYHSSSPPSSPPQRVHRRRARTPPRSSFDSPSVRQIPIEEYISWHVTRAPEDAEIYFAALEWFQRDRIKVNQLRNLSAEIGKNYGVPPGIQMSLIDDPTIFRSKPTQSGIPELYYN